jgi:formiminotetrahydrofolate cyclodeaminase
MKDLAIDEWLETLAARQPTPGGGSVAALAAASAAALIGMVSIYTTGTKWADREVRMLELNNQAEGWRIRALELAQQDEVAFAAVGAAYGLPKGTDQEVAARQEAIQVALVGAALPPIRTAELAGDIVEAAEELVDRSNPNVLSDVGVASAMAEAAISSASLNIAINLSQVTDAGERKRLSASLVTATLNSQRAREVTQRVLAAVSS